MLNSAILPRPFSCHVPRVEGYEPQISCKVTRVSTGKNAWRYEALVDQVAMSFGHARTKREAESKVSGMMDAYTEVHYISK